MCFYFQFPMLSQATSDDEKPTPGFMYQEINSILVCKIYINDNYQCAAVFQS